ncbi:hypothetical protein BH10ACT11_BH10ACT11_11230 [soil metagenome]
MFTRVSSHIRSNIVGYLALYVALGGVAMAAGHIGAGDIKNNAVHSNHIKNGQVKAADLAPGSVSGTNVSDGSLSGADLAANAVNSAKVADNSLNGNDIQDSSLTGADVGPNTLTGTNIDESSLGKVGDANTLDGIDSSGFVPTGTLQVIPPTTMSVGTFKTLASVGTLNLKAACGLFWKEQTHSWIPSDSNLVTFLDGSSRYTFSSQSLGGAAGDSGGVDIQGGQSFLMSVGGDETATPATGFVEEGGNYGVFNIYQIHDTNFQGNPFCTYGGYLVVN